MTVASAGGLAVVGRVIAGLAFIPWNIILWRVLKGTAHSARRASVSEFVIAGVVLALGGWLLLLIWGGVFLAIDALLLLGLIGPTGVAQGLGAVVGIFVLLYFLGARPADPGPGP
jgi:hypothetical protein